MRIQSHFKISLLCFILLTLPQIIAFTHVHASPEREWTFMVYLDADNNLESAGIKDLNEMETVGSSDNLAIIVQMDRIPGYDSSNGNWTETRRYYVTKDNDTQNINSDLLENLGELNMGDNSTLLSFVIWSMQTYPAQHYALILWDHGGSCATGPGACWDDTNPQDDCLTLKEIKKALADIYSTTGKKIDVLAFDACLMGTIEVAYQVRDYVNYMVASEETEPNDGCPYDMILTELAASPSMSPAQLASTIVTKYVSSYTDGLPNPEDAPHVTSAAFNLTKVDEAAVAVSQLAEAIIGDFNNSESAVRSAWEQAETFRGDYVDLYNFTQLLNDKVSNVTIKTKAESVLDAVNSLIISEGHGTVHSNAHGVSIYYPKKYDKLSYVGLDFAFDTLWDEFLDFATNIDVEITPVCPTYTSDENVAFMDVAVGDVDGDQEPEIVAVGNYSESEENTYFTIAVFDITENGLVQLCNLTLSLSDYEKLLSVTCADVDNDTIDEIVTCGDYYDVSEYDWYSYIGIFTVEGNELILQAYDEGANISVESLDVADVDGDNFPEIVISGYCWDDFSVYAYVAVGNNSAVTSIELECSYYWDIGYSADLKSVVVGDTDADGLAEIVVGGEYYDYYYYTWVAYVAVLNCSQNSLYLQAYDSGVNFWINSVDVADVDGNGLNEIVISGYCWDYYGNIYMFISIGSNYQNPNEIIGLGIYYWSVSGDSFICSVDVADVEGDGIAEIIAVGYYYDAENFTWKSYTAVLSWSSTTGLVVENVQEGDSQTYAYSVATENVDDDSQTEIITCSQETGSSSRARIEVFEASNNVVTTGTISGTVTDGENPIPNAVVEISIPRLSVVTSVNTLANGTYSVNNIPEECYTVKVYAQGKASSTENGVIVKAGKNTELNFVLENIVTTINHPVNVGGQTFYVVTVSNSTISNFAFNITAKSISFSVAAATGLTGFCNVTFPESLLGPPYTVTIDDIPTTPTTSSNGTHTFIHLSYTHSFHTIKIVGSSGISEFSTNVLLLFSACAISFLTLLIKKRKKS